MIDSHCHLDFAVFDADRDSVLYNAAAQGVQAIVIPGTTLASAPFLLDLCKSHPQCYPALGLHPYFLRDYRPQHLQQLEGLIKDNRQHIVAVGEIGLDSQIDVDLDLQKDVLDAQLRLAARYALPVIVHHRKTHHLLLGALGNAALVKAGVIHAFSGSIQDAHRYIEMGYKLGVGGVITYPRAQKTRETLSKVPLGSLVLETDAPDMPMQGRQGQRNSPEYLYDVAQCLAQLRGISVDEVMTVTSENSRRLFSL
ncbi:TatD family hydrolase [Aestuariibacter salexigens]|uniref:TatD family hydrolase n=1 Tax=Aestuariibacter salexigens TaxID=226010 RepID=UPI00041A21F9|nr:TatD family hydrolase [Aestuariibacter salexigens]